MHEEMQVLTGLHDPKIGTWQRVAHSSETNDLFKVLLFELFHTPYQTPDRWLFGLRSIHGWQRDQNPIEHLQQEMRLAV